MSNAWRGSRARFESLRSRVTARKALRLRIARSRRQNVRAGSRGMSQYPRLVAERKTGSEPFTDGGAALPLTLGDFWCWSTSDLVNSTTRGVLAEFLVAAALGLADTGVREAWASYDLRTADGIKIEVKSAAYMQGWGQRRPSRIAFGVGRTRAWDPDSNELVGESARQADVYVFALLQHADKLTLNPLDVSQWHFYVVPRAFLDTRAGAQRSVTLGTVAALAGESVAFRELGAAVRRAAHHQQEAVRQTGGAEDPGLG